MSPNFIFWQKCVGAPILPLCVHMCVCVCVWAHECFCVCLCLCVHACVLVLVSEWVSEWQSERGNVCVCVCVCVCVFVFFKRDYRNGNLICQDLETVQQQMTLFQWYTFIYIMHFKFWDELCKSCSEFLNQLSNN